MRGDRKMRSLLQDFTSVIFDAFDRAADYLLGNDARFQYLRKPGGETRSV